MAEPLINYIDLPLTEVQKAMANLIDMEFANAGLSRALAAAAIVNSYKESGFDTLKVFYGRDYPKTGIKTEDSVGLFQLNSMNGGLGTGMPKGNQYPQGDSRKNPILNVKRVIRKIKNTKAARDEFASLDKDLPKLTASFTKWIEVPANLKLAMAEREELAKKVFPNGIEGTDFPRGDQVPADNPFVNSEMVEAPAKWTDEDKSRYNKIILMWVAGFAAVALIRYKAKGKKPWEL
jgi:hypothetical protein